MAPKLGPKAGLKSARILCQFLQFVTKTAEVKAFLQWVHLARSGTAKIPLYINMDETSLCFNYGRRRGLLVSKRALPPGRKYRKEQVKSGDLKAYVSFLAFFTHDTSIQAKLPQILIGNTHRFTQKLLNKVSSYVPKNFYLFREQSSWNNHNLMRKALTLLVQHLRDYQGSHEFILVLDVARCHVHNSIFSLASRLGVRIVFVPGKLTWLLQPADTHVFARFKLCLRQLWHSLLAASSSGTVSNEVWLVEVLRAARQLFNGVKWAPAFKAAGMLDPTYVSIRILRQVGWEALPDLPLEALTVEQLKYVFPKRTRIVFRSSLFSWCLPKAVAKAKPSAASSSSSAPPVLPPTEVPEPPGPISARTRLKRKAFVFGC